VGLLVSSPVYARGGADILAEIFLRVLLEGMARGIAPPPPAPVPAPVPVVGAAIVPLVIPDPDAKIRPDPSLRLKDQELGYYPPEQAPTFRVRDFTRTFYTMVGGSAKDASQLLEQDGIDDPAVTVSDDLTAIIARHYDGHDVGLVQEPTAGTETAPAAAMADPGAPLGSGFALQVNTTHWELKSVSANPLHIMYGVNHYGIYYDAHFRLMDRRDGSILAEGDCSTGPAATDPAPTYDEAMADGGKQLSGMMQSAAHECARSMAKEYLGINLPSPAPATQ
jgi:hypothetical protein